MSKVAWLLDGGVWEAQVGFPQAGEGRVQGQGIPGRECKSKGLTEGARARGEGQVAWCGWSP